MPFFHVYTVWSHTYSKLILSLCLTLHIYGLFSGTNCPIVFSIISPGRRSLQATPIDGVTDQTICEAMCRNDATCLAYQIDIYPDEPFCWHQKSQAALNDLYDDSSIFEYVKQFNCGGASSSSLSGSYLQFLQI